MKNIFFVSKNVLVEEDSLWMLTNDTNVLCQFDLSSMKYLSSFVLPEKKITQYGHYSFTKVGKNVYVLPFINEDMFVIDIQTGEIKREKIPYKNSEKTQYGKFRIIGNDDNKILMIGHNIKGIFVYDDKGFRVSYKYLDILKGAGIDITQEDSFFSDCYLQLGSKIYIPLYKNNYLFIVNIENESYQIIKMDEEIRLRTIDIINEKEAIFLFTTVDDERVIWSLKKGIIEKRKLNVLNLGEKIYIRAYYINNKYYYISAYERKIFVEKDYKMLEIPFEYPNGEILEEGIFTQFEAVFKNGKNIFFQARSDGSVFYIDTESDSIKRKDINISQEQKNSLIKETYYGKKNEDVWKENYCLNLSNFIEIVK